MKLLISIASLVIFLTMGIQSQEENQTQKEEVITTAKVEVYYFHNTRRCATCEAVEDVTIETLQESYPDQLKSGIVTFVSLDLEDDNNEPLARKLHVSGQTLLIVKEGKKKDLTNDAFLYARTKPEKLKEKINKVIGTI